MAKRATPPDTPQPADGAPAGAVPPGVGAEPSRLVERLQEIVRESERLFLDLAAGDRRLRALGRAVWRVEEEERRRLARELHDGIGQTLTALKTHLELLARRAAASGGDLEAALASAAGLASQALAETRELSRLLRPAVLDDLGLGPALRWLTRSLGEQTGMAVELTVSGLDGRLDPEVETVAFRVVQEALANAVRHSGSRRAWVRVEVTDGRLSLMVGDEGRGFATEAAFGGQGTGLAGMRDRLQLFGGTLRVESSPAGTVLRARVPLDDGGAEGP